MGILAVLAVVLSAGNAGAAPAGAVVTSPVDVTYVSGGAPYAASAGHAFPVDRAVDVSVVKNTDAVILPSDTNAALSFLVTNLTNTVMRFNLAVVSQATNSWTLNNVRIYRDDNNSGTLDGGDTQYSDAASFGDLATGATTTVLIVADAPANLTAGQAALYDLIATAVDAGALTVASQTAGPDTTGVDTVFRDAAGSTAGDGARDGRHSATAAFNVSLSALSVVLNKTVVVLDQWGGSDPIPGATLRYTITATTTGSGTASNVTITDPLPPNTAYVAGSLRLNGAALTDAADGDAGDAGATTPNEVTVRLGNLTSLSPAQTIQFEVRIP